jgi:hypothetical protein
MAEVTEVADLAGMAGTGRARSKTPTGLDRPAEASTRQTSVSPSR